LTNTVREHEVAPQETLADERGALTRRRAQVHRAASAGSPDPAAGLAALVTVDDAIRDFDSRVHADQVDNLVRVQDAMARLRTCDTTADLIRAAPRELCDSCGFTRAMISRVHGSLWMPQALEIQPGIDPLIDDFRAFTEGTQIPLERMLLETDLVRRRIAALVTDPGNDPRTLTPLVEVARTTSYVAAPIMAARHVIGFVHADRFGLPEPVTAGDRDMLWVFAEHFALLYERAVLVARLVDQRSRLTDALARAATGIDELYNDELELIRRGSPIRSGTGARSGPAPSRIDALLTAREREVLELLATGATNAAVGRQLVVSAGTIKSHTRRIHRKLHVNTRAEAVAKFLRLAAQDEERAG
jgi:LuxR family transcriptional regulator, regulator of acetate metabolism